jgi:hypothetical protein
METVNRVTFSKNRRVFSQAEGMASAIKNTDEGPISRFDVVADST